MRHRLSFSFATVMALGALVPGCKGASDGSGGAGGVNGAGVIDALCAHVTRCASVQGALTDSEQACVDLYVDVLSHCDGSVWLANTAEQVAACVTYFTESSCDAGVFDEQVSGSTPCDVIAIADGPGDPIDVPANPGAQCDGSCVDGYYCDGTVAAGTCHTCVPDVAIGGGCGFDQACVAGSFCDYGGTDLCTALGVAGAACRYDEECASSYCDGTGHCAERLARDAACGSSDECLGNLICYGGTCTDRQGADAACTSDSQCLLGYACVAGACAKQALCGRGDAGEACMYQGCATGLYCSDADTCAPRLALGDPCEVYGSDEACQAGLVCRPDAAASVATCQLPGDVGDRCAWDENCLATLYCNFATGTCATLVAADAPCTAGDHCVDGYFCSYLDLVCTARLANGETCFGSSWCQSSYCNWTTNTCEDPLACQMP